MKQNSIIYGPVPSRRLGRSLGIDVVPYKTCSYDCIYCQLGATTSKTVERQEFICLKDAMRELREHLPSKPDYITIAGSGEPCLCKKIDALIAGIKDLTTIPVVVITNGSLLSDPDIRSELKYADIVVPSLDAGTDRIFKYVNRPHDSISYDTMLEGLKSFRQMYEGQYWLEVFLLTGVNTTTQEQEYIKKAVDEINPDKVQLNTVARPPCEVFAEAVPLESLKLIAKQFGSIAEIIADYQDNSSVSEDIDVDKIIDLLNRRPCTLIDLSNGMKCSPNLILKMAKRLVEQDKIKTTTQNGRVFYIRH
jgi:wyosine [tRNA(Phe)-imidazoG37] synthetase (radical SAM superfamily)